MNQVEKIAGDLISFVGGMKREYFKPAENIARSRLSPAQFHTLSILYWRSSLPMSELAGVLKISKQQLTPLIAKLSDCQMVVRKPDDEDRRIVRIEITDEGRATYKSLFSAIRSNLTERLSLISEQDLAELEPILKRMAEILLPENNDEGGGKWVN